MDSYKELGMAEQKNKYMIMAALGFLGLGGVHRFAIALKAKDEQQAFLGGMFLLPLALFILLVVFGDGSVRAWYFLPFLLTYGLTIFDLLNMNKLLSGELSAKKAWYETWPGRVGAVILFPIALWFIYTKTDLPKKQKNAIAGALAAGLALFLGASFTGVEQLLDEVPASSQTSEEAASTDDNKVGDSTSQYANCDEVRAAGLTTPLKTDNPAYADYLDRDSDGLACE